MFCFKSKISTTKHDKQKCFRKTKSCMEIMEILKKIMQVAIYNYNFFEKQLCIFTTSIDSSDYSA